MKLSIITINYNNVDGLRKTMESVFAQSCKDFEYIVVDGASTDGSVDVIRELEQKHLSLSLSFPFFWVSEKDTGIYNAMNKGVRKAKGDYVLMLNSGDYLVDEHVVERILPELDGTDIVQGNLIEEFPSGTKVHRGPGHSDLHLYEALYANFPHQAAFSRRETFERYGMFDESYSMISDTIYFIKCLAFGDATYKYVDINVANFDIGGISNTQKGKGSAERNRMYTELLSPRLLDYMYNESKKIDTYDRLKRHTFIWKIVLMLLKIANKF